MIQKAIGAVKDQMSIGIAKVSSNMAPDLEVAIVKSTSHEEDLVDEKYVWEILSLTSSSRGYVNECVCALSKLLGKTRDWILALKAVTLIHRVLNEGDLLFHEEILYATRRGARLLNLSDFRDEEHSSSWDHSVFVRAYSMYLDQRLELLLFDKKVNKSEGGSASSDVRFGGRDDFCSPPLRSYDYDYRNYGMIRRSRSYGDMSDVVD
ncbi:ANTH domain-containing protein [Cephalotus follicularis]|uniref:ANTH domain-containing protein n=1 Tax=Cephalotus follicularis TaxID=3775 RepID=A0A1Q3CCB8_CEPFO|nr:ANTH domain-containing protein [Cephalotus follicularis]